MATPESKLRLLMALLAKGGTPADASYVNPKTPADDAESAAIAERTRVYGRPHENYGLLPHPAEDHIRSDSAWNSINRNFDHAMHSNILTGQEPDSTAKAIDKDFDSMAQKNLAALLLRKQYPRTGRTGPG